MGFESYADAERVLIPSQLVMAMLAMGATLLVKDFVAVVRFPRSLALALALHWIVAPALAVGVARAFGASEGWTIGLLLIGLAPPAAMSNLWTHVGRGNVALSVS